MKSLPLLSTTQLGAALQSARKGQGLTQAEVASRLGISQSRVSHLEKNPGQLSVDQLLHACAVLGLELRIGLRDTAGDASAAAVGEW